jgi:hypothetical protein
MRFRFTAAVVVAGLLGATTARSVRAEDPCAADVEQFCHDVKVGGGRVQDCLRQNDARLSPSCKERRSAAEASFRERVRTFGVACGRDAQRLCSEVRPGRGRIVQCLGRQQDDLSDACQAEVERVQSAVQTITTLETTCREEVKQLCAGVPPEAGPLVECLRARRENLSQDCRAFDLNKAMAAAEIVEAVNELSSEDKAKEASQILQGIESVAFSRSQLLLQLDSYQGVLRSANANRLLFNPQIVFGPHRELAVQLKAPVYAVYPYAADRPAQTGLGAVTTAIGWAFYRSPRLNQYLSFGFQWLSPVAPPVGAAWAIAPSYAASFTVERWLSVTGQVGWVRSFASSGYPDLNVLLMEPIVVVKLPGRSFVALDTRLGVNFVDGAFLPVMKGIVGLYVDRRKSLSLSAWYQAALTGDAVTDTFKFGVGMALGYFFDW